MEITRTAIANHLRSIRKLKGLSPEEAEAKGTGVTASYVRRLEKGASSPTVEMLERICNAYDIDLLKFFESFAEANSNGRRRTA